MSCLLEEDARFIPIDGLTRPITILVKAIIDRNSIPPSSFGKQNNVINIHDFSNNMTLDNGFHPTNF